MKKSILLQLLIVLAMVFFFQNVALAADEIEQIKQAIADKDANWTAGENWVTKLSPEERKRLCGAILEPPDPSQTTLLSIPLIDNLPPVFDWRDNNGNWVTPVKNQGGCGSCWDFSAVGQLEAWWKIHNVNLDSMIDLSEQFVLSCSEGSCEGWGTHLALDFIKLVSVPTEACFAYQADDEVPCSDACSNWADEAITIPGWGWITLEEDLIDNIKSAVYRHPVSARFTVYADFFSYSGGVYEHVWGEEVSGHAILIVGWNDEEQSWICKNSYGKWWGEAGYFRIKWSNCGIGRYMPFIWDGMTGGPALAVSPDTLHFSLTVGDSANGTIIIDNLGADVLEFSTMDYEVPIAFHPDGFMAWDNLSWWCGDPHIGGYGDHWLQYLDTPILDLSGTVAPHLSLMGFWSIEDPAGAEPPYDGWDGCNVWVSDDGGKTFNVAYPTSPDYNCQSLWSFGHPEQGWNMGIGIAGWAANSGGWIPVEFDLSPYKSDSVIIRFTLASDMGISAITDPLLYGFFVDEIIVTDGGNVLFEDHGDDIHAMRRIGYGLGRADWIDISNGAGVIQPNESALVDITIKTRNLTPGSYSGLMSFTSNDTILPLAEVALNLELRAPDHDIAIEEVWPPGENIPILFSGEPSAKIKNWGLNDETDFDVTCTVLHEGQPDYSDTAHIALLVSGESRIVKFEPLLVLKTGELDFSITLSNLSDDYNTYNNSVRSTTMVTNLVDDFETETGFWSFQGGWGITDIGAHWLFSAHVNNGFPYLNNMDGTMTYTPGFDITSVDTVTLKFWTRYRTEQDRDICYVEASGDSITWVKMDSLSGTNWPEWTPHEVGLTDFIDTGYTKVWVRFHFVSDSTKVSMGVWIDDVEIYPEAPTYVREVTDKSIPTEWKLSQNYPNPFNMTTRLEYSMPKGGEVKIVIYNIKGQVVHNLLETYLPAGHHFIDWDGCDNNGYQVGTGGYLYHLEVKGNFSNTKKMILMK